MTQYHDLPYRLPLAESLNSTEVLQSILDAAPIAIVMVDQQGNIVYANEKLAHMFGYSQQELLQQPIELLMPERFRQDHRAHRADFALHPRVRPMGSGMDLAARRKDGTEFPIEAGLSPIQVGDEMLVVGSITDVSRRKQIEEMLEQRVEERTRELERRRQVADGLRDILAILNSNRTLRETLDYIVGQACRLLHADASAIYQLGDEEGLFIVQAAYGLPPELLPELPHTQPAGQANPDGFPTGSDPTASTPRAPHTSPQSLPSRPRVTRQADFVQIRAGDGAEEPGTQPGDAQDPLENHYQAVLTVPLIIKEDIYGSLMLYYREPRKFSVEEIELATTMGDQTALAIENARLRTQVEHSAVAAERNRIARDLHDSVTQTLFSASLIAEVLPKLWAHNPEDGRRRLEELRQLTRGALAEMRTLLLELRPATLIEVDLGELLRQLTEAITGRARVPIDLTLEGDHPLPPDVKVAFYHIAQEALNNVAKHARAQHVTVHLVRQPEGACLTVTDDGRGFVLDAVTPEHLGLTIMHERADAIGARLEITSRRGQGTQVQVTWHAPATDEAEQAEENRCSSV